MRRLMNSCSVPFLTLAMTACAHTSMTSVAAPEAATQTFRKIVVMASFADLGLRQETEARFAAKSVPGQYQFVPSAQLFYPGRQFSQAEVDSVFRQYSIDALLVLEPGGTGNKTTYIPPTFTSTCTTPSCRQVTTSTTGGGTYSKPWAEFSAQLYSVATGQSVWFATAKSKGNAYADTADLVHSMADKTVEDLAKDGVIR